MAITLTLKNRSEVEVLVNALDIQCDILNDTVLEDLYLSAEDVRDLATKPDDYIQKALQVIRSKVSQRIDLVIDATELLNRAQQVLDAFDGK